MERAWWFLVVDRNGSQLVPVACLDLRPGARVVDFLRALGGMLLYRNANLVEVSVFFLKVYKDRGAYDDPQQTPLGLDGPIEELGESIADALIVEVPRVWYELLDADTGDTFPHTVVSWVTLADENTAHDLMGAVFAKVSSVLPENVIADSLRIYATKTVYNQENRTPLESFRTLKGMGKHAGDPLIVEVPRPRKRLKCSTEIPIFKWDTPQPREELAIAEDSKLVSLPLPCVRGSGVGRNEKLVLFRRQQLVDEWNNIKKFSINHFAVLWIYGPPGTGKSCAALAYACSLDSSEWDLLWIHHSRPGQFLNCVWLQGSTREGGTKQTCVIDYDDVELHLPELLRLASTPRNPTSTAVGGTSSIIRKIIVFLDGYVTNSDVMERALRKCNAWQRLDRGRRRLVCVTSMAKIDKTYRRSECDELPDLEEKRASGVEPMDTSEGDLVIHDTQSVYQQLFKLHSWTLEDYKIAIEEEDFFRSVEKILPPYTEDPKKPELDQRFKRVEEKYFVAGGSARVMFDFDSVNAVKYLDEAIEAVENAEACSKMLGGSTASHTINRLMAIYPRAHRPDEPQLVSKYVTRALAMRLGPDLLKSLAKLNAVNPSVDGYIFEAWFFSELSFNGISWYSLGEARPTPWARSDVIYFDPGLPIGDYLKDRPETYREQTWMAPLKWNQAGYDAVFVDIPSKLVRFVQVTRADRHPSFHHYSFVQVLNKLADVEGLDPFQVVEMTFVIPKSKLTTFRIPTDDIDIRKNILEVAGAPERATRSSSTGLPFKKCTSTIQVLGVEYDLTDRRPVPGTRVG